MSDYLSRIRARHLSGETGGLTAVCSTHHMVLKAAFEKAASYSNALLVEATSNQVNQYGGYAGMRPSAYINYIYSLAEATGFPRSRLIIGADHLGPHPWTMMPADLAMERAAVLVKECVKAGFNKIHLDTGMGCADDPNPTPAIDIISERSATLCLAAESQVHQQPANHPLPLYVIGAEVPRPGGGLTDNGQLIVTPVKDIASLLDATKKCFIKKGLLSAWERVVAVVVQPGIDFGDIQVARYLPNLAAELVAYHSSLPGIMTYEVHAADYQSPGAIEQMVMDHFTILKVGPCLTNAYREAIYALAHIEMDWLKGKKGCRLSGIRSKLESVMKNNPEHWQNYYEGNSAKVAFLRQYSYRDRMRYYWHYPEIDTAMKRLQNNLNHPIPPVLLKQYFPDLYPAIASGEITPTVRSLIKERIGQTLTPYIRASQTTSR